MTSWNPWHGCTKISTGCRHCYMYRRDAQYGKDSSIVTKTASFDLPIRRKKNGDYKLTADGHFVLTCFTSDFFHPAADAWRAQAWAMIRERSDLDFYFITKRPERFLIGLPQDWGNGYPNVHIGCTCENQYWTDRRLPLFLELPIQHKYICQEPMLEEIHIESYLKKYHNQIEEVSCGGESGEDARLCDYAWVMQTMLQCVEYEVPFTFHQTGALFKRGDQTYHVQRKYQHSQAKKARIDYPGTTIWPPHPQNSTENPMQPESK